MVRVVPFWSTAQEVRTIRDVSTGAGIALALVSFANRSWLWSLLSLCVGVIALVARRRLEDLNAARTAARRFTPLNRVALVDALGSEYKGRIAIIVAAGNGESMQLAEDLREGCAACGFSVFGPLALSYPTALVGVAVGVHRPEGKDLAERLGETIRAAGIACEVNNDNPQGELFTINIGRKP